MTDTIKSFVSSQNNDPGIRHTRLKKIGLIGGISWHSTVEYYSYLNQIINSYFNNNTNPPLILLNLDQYYIHSLQRSGNWDLIVKILIEACNKLQQAGASSIIFCANTPHKVYDEVQQHSAIPILHVAHAIGMNITKRGFYKVGLIGTIFTMEESFITTILRDDYNITVIVPEKEKNRKRLHTIIQEELSHGIVNPETKKYIMDQLMLLEKRGAEGIILGCTEFPLIIKQKDLEIPIFNTTLIHAQLGADFILGLLKY